MSDDMISEEELAMIEELAKEEAEGAEETQKSEEMPANPTSSQVIAQKKQSGIDVIEFSKRLRADVEFNENTLQTEFMRQAALVAYYSTVSHRNAEVLEKAKAKLDLVEAMIDNEIREEAVTNGEKVTEASVAKKIKLDTRFQAAQRAVIEARTKAGITKDAMEALRHKRDMLIQYGADQREEMKGELRLNRSAS